MDSEIDPHQLENMSSRSLHDVRTEDNSAKAHFFQIDRSLVHACRRRAGCLIANPAHGSDELSDVPVDRCDRQSIGRFRDWLRMISRNKISRIVRRAPRLQVAVEYDLKESPQQLLDPVSIPQQAFFHAQQNLSLQDALKKLRAEIKDHTWEVFWRTTVEGQDARRVAGDLHTKLGVVYQAKFRTLNRLRELIAEIDSCRLSVK